MESSVQSGDIAGAQTSLATYQQDTQSSQSVLGGNSAPLGSSSAPTAFRSDLTAFASAVQSGNIGDAQSALQTLQQAQQAPGFGAGSPPSASDGTTGSGVSVLNDLNAMLSSLLSGDSSGAQSAANTLENDLQVATGTQTAAGSPSNQLPSSSTTSSSNPVLNDLQSLIADAQSGNTDGAQQAAQSLVNDLQNADATSTSSHHHHGGGHHHADAGSTSSSAAQGSSLTSASSLASAAQQAYQSVLALAANSPSSTPNAI